MNRLTGWIIVLCVPSAALRLSRQLGCSAPFCLIEEVLGRFLHFGEKIRDLPALHVDYVDYLSLLYAEFHTARRLNHLRFYDGGASRFVYCDSGRMIQRKWARMGL